MGVLNRIEVLALVCAPRVSKDFLGGIKRFWLRMPSLGQKFYSDSNALVFEDSIDLNDLVDLVLYNELDCSFKRSIESIF